jgi:hypothetical protein
LLLLRLLALLAAVERIPKQFSLTQSSATATTVALGG